MKIRISLFFLVGVFMIMPGVLAGKIEIHFMDNVVLEEKIITFRDISTVSGDDEELVNKINSIELGKTPWANNTRRLSQDFLKMRLSLSKVNTADVSFINARSVVVSVESAKLTGAEIAQKAKEYLLDVMPVAGKETTIELVSIPNDQWIPRRKERIDLDFSLVDPGKDRGNVELIVSASSGGTCFFKIPVFFKIRVYEDVVVARKKIGRKQQLHERDISVVRRETTNIGGFTFSRVDDLIGKATTTTVQPNAVITEDMVEILPAIKQGAVVEVYIQSNGFKIVTKGIAQETGHIGDVIRVKNIHSDKQLYGTIVNSDKVRILF
ncbi:MAG: flagellar basal body P-ring formation chaperone FlgA [Candidatus Loosdrechtia sp.]|uniref:flagella basal body P-ring formation protein FlgA n=1 Tax=Candidatus Loosdrechtia sp. TaxID=3101272 RepID=UPI003A756DB0|nr:MAG: flagellar basal body P-ring formation chaperone FlgA [Candidatus Jettenia sp. AMX2]